MDAPSIPFNSLECGTCPAGLATSLIYPIEPVNAPSDLYPPHPSHPDTYSFIASRMLFGWSLRAFQVKFSSHRSHTPSNSTSAPKALLATAATPRRLRRTRRLPPPPTIILVDPQDGDRNNIYDDALSDMDTYVPTIADEGTPRTVVMDISDYRGPKSSTLEDIETMPQVLVHEIAVDNCAHEVQPSPALRRGKILQHIPGFEDDAAEKLRSKNKIKESHSPSRASLSQTLKYILEHEANVIAGMGLDSFVHPPLHHKGITRSRLVYVPQDTPGLCPKHHCCPCGPCSIKDPEAQNPNQTHPILTGSFLSF